MLHLELVLALLAVAVALALLAKRIPVPLPILLVLGGLAIGVVRRFAPGVPTIALTPNLVFLVFLPPLLFSAAYESSLGSMRRNAVPISLLAVGLVLATVVAVAYVTRIFVPTLPLAAAFVLGAIVSPPDPIAAASVAGRVGLPTRLLTIIEGEGLINDVTALTAYQIAVDAVVSGTFSWSHAALAFAQAAVVGALVGFGAGRLTTAVLARVDDAVLETVITLLGPYVTYLAADRLGGSAVLAVVIAGFVVRERITDVGRASTRLSGRAVWQTLVFLVNGMIFILIGFELGDIASAGLPANIVIGTALVSGVAIVVRLAWMFTTPHVVRLARMRLARGAPIGSSSWRELAVLGWAGMRGVVSIAAALSLPLYALDDHPFPARGFIVLVTFGFVFVTLVLQGLTLPPLVRWLGMSDPDAAEREEEMGRRRAARAGLAQVDAAEQSGRISSRAARHLRNAYVWALRPEDTAIQREVAAIQSVGQAALEAERKVVRKLRDEERIGADAADELEEEIDARDVQLGDGLPGAGDAPHPQRSPTDDG